MKIEWQSAIYSRASNAQIADVGSHRLYVCRSRKGARHFTGYIDGVRVQGSCRETMDQSKGCVIAEARRMGILRIVDEISAHGDPL